MTAVRRYRPVDGVGTGSLAALEGDTRERNVARLSVRTARRRETVLVFHPGGYDWVDPETHGERGIVVYRGYLDRVRDDRIYRECNERHREQFGE